MSNTIINSVPVSRFGGQTLPDLLSSQHRIRNQINRIIPSGDTRTESYSHITQTSVEETSERDQRQEDNGTQEERVCFNTAILLKRHFLRTYIRRGKR